MPFEEPVIKLREKIDELKHIAQDADVDMSGEIEKLEVRLEQLEKSIYSNMAPWIVYKSRDILSVLRH